MILMLSLLHSVAGLLSVLTLSQFMSHIRIIYELLNIQTCYYLFFRKVTISRNSVPFENVHP